MSGRKWPVQDPTFTKDTTASLGCFLLAIVQTPAPAEFQSHHELILLQVYSEVVESMA